MKLKFPRLDFKTSVLLVAGASIATHLIIYVLSIFSAASLEQLLIVPSLVPLLGPSVSISLSIVFALSVVLFWWILVVITDWASVKYFKAKQNYDYLISAYAVSFAVISVVDLFISIFTVVPSIVGAAIGFIVYLTALREVYKTDWIKSILIVVSVSLLQVLVIIASAVVGGILGFGLGSVIF